MMALLKREMDALALSFRMGIYFQQEGERARDIFGSILHCE